MRHALKILLSSALLLSACSLDALTVDGGELSQRATPVEFNQSDAIPAASSTAEVVERVLPSVVNVRVRNIQFDVLGDPTDSRGQGSGVVIDRSGIILTNNHVIEGAAEVNVFFTDDRDPLEGRVLGTVPERDLAVIKVDADDLPAIELGRSENLRLGEDVIAIGFPLGLGGATVTKGIISAVERNIDVGGTQGLQGLLQTDAAINPGNSGGALVDASGRLVGINTAAAQAGTAENIGFAIPIDAALPVIEEILREPPESRGWLGVQVGDLDGPVAAQLGLDSGQEGALVAGVFPDSPAESAGLEQGDVIVDIGGETIASAEDLTTTLAELDPGQTVQITLVSEDGERTVDVELDQRPGQFELPDD